eukprot:jgi/Chrpa1/11475/Chrysochromulina_OHIO_Genome00021003-RA
MDILDCNAANADSVLLAERTARAWSRAHAIRGKSTQTPAWWLGDAAFEADVRALSDDSTSPSVLDVSPLNILNYSQGSFSLIEHDLHAAFGREAAAQSLAVLRTESVERCFALRRELVNMKKALLVLFQDAQRVVKQLRRAQNYFHISQSFEERAQLLDSPRYEQYNSVCETLQRAKGLTRALHDARDLTKGLCTLPRHPEEHPRTARSGEMAIPAGLRNLPRSMHAWKALANADAFLAALGARDLSLGAHDLSGAPDLTVAGDDDAGSGQPGAAAEEEGEHESGPQQAAAATAAAQSCSGEALWTASQLPPSGYSVGITAEILSRGLSAVVAAHGQALDWPPSMTRYVRLVLIARGGAKALAMADATERYRATLQHVHERSASSLAALHAFMAHASARLEQAGIPSMNSAAGVGMGGPDGADDLPSRPTEELTDEVSDLWSCHLRASKHACQLEAILAANTQLLALISLVAARRTQHCGERMARSFVAGDAVRGATAAMFVPPEFRQLAAQLAAITAEARQLDESMRRSIAVEGWPPPTSAGRARVVLDGVGAFECCRCERSCSGVWAAHILSGARSCVCWECEGALRSAGTCPHDGAYDGAARSGSSISKAPPTGVSHAAFFCVHQQKCVVCDGASYATCTECRMGQGDGDAVAALCMQLEPEVLFLDFDRTLATTRSGGSPLDGVHALDVELADLMAAGVPTWVVTRNRHVVEIGAFLKSKGVHAAGVKHAPQGISKAKAIVEVLPSLLCDSPGTIRAIFVDDDVRECCDPALVKLPGLLRVLFRRGAV